MNCCLDSLKTTNKKDQNVINLNELRFFLVDYIDNIFKQIDTNKVEVQIYNEALTQLHLLKSLREASLIAIILVSSLFNLNSLNA